MSALAGLWRQDGRLDAAEGCRRMLAAQHIYGPHASADWSAGDVALGRCLFRSLPEDRHDRQPLQGGGGRYALVADVRLDDREGLARALGLDSPDLPRTSDSALLLAAWERLGEGLFDAASGDYAFALWDSAERRLILARDALGGRPLHYHPGKGFAAFASMPKGLHALPEIPYAPDEVRGAEFLALLPEHGPRSFFEGISRVEPGEIVRISADGTVARRRHWQPRREAMRAPPGDFQEGLRHHLDQAVASRLRGSGGTVAAHLSAGLDSSAVAATAARLLARDNGRVVAFTSAPPPGFDSAAVRGGLADESALAAATAALYPNMEHVLVRSDVGRTVLDDIDRDFFLFERPLVNVDVQSWWNRINAEAQRRRIGVLLTGLNGNNTISYAGMELLPELLAGGRFLKLLRTARRLRRSGRVRLGTILAASVGPWVPERLWNAISERRRGWSWDVTRYTTLRPERLRALDLPATARAHGLDLAYRPRRDPFGTRLWALRRVDWGNNVKGVLAGWGVDMRDPTADRRLVEYCLSLPAEAFLAGGIPRGLARAAFADRLPAEVVGETRKGIQSVDWFERLTTARSELRDEIARLEEVPAAAEALDLERMRALVEDWPEDWSDGETEMAYGMALQRGIVSGRFFRKASRSNA
jgi:asparagine synthase (glutamine-hydrolysing)